MKPSVGTWDDPGIIDYKALNLRQGTCTPLIEVKTWGTYCHDSKSDQIIVYDSVTVIREKVKYVKEMNLAGVMFWEASADIYADPRDGLISAAKAAMFPFTLDRIRNNLCYPSSPYANINYLQNCTIKSGGPVPDVFAPGPVGEVNEDNVRKSVPFGSRIHQK